MAYLFADINFRSVALGAATAKSVAGFQAPTNQVVRIHEIAISFDGVTIANAPVVVDLNRCTFATNLTSSTGFTPLKRDPGRAETVQTTGKIIWTSEPTVLTAQQSIDVPEFNGVYHLIIPFTVPLIVVGGQGFVITCTSPAIVNCSGHITIEE